MASASVPPAGHAPSRRRFVTWAALAAMPCPVPAAAPLAIACLSSQAPETATLDAFRAALARLDGPLAARIRYDPYFARYDKALLHRHARLLNERAPALILCFDFDAAAAAVATRTPAASVPVVFRAHDDPLGRGLIASYARPGGNLTGVTTYRCVDAKLLELMGDALPAARRFGFLHDPANPDGGCHVAAHDYARGRSIALDDYAVGSAADLDTALRRLGGARPDALVVSATAVTWQQRRRIVARVDELAIPAIYEGKVFVDAGGLMQFSALQEDAFDRMARAVAYVVRYGRAGDFPVSQPVRFELMINLAAAHARAYRLSPAILRRADRIVE